MLNDFLPRLTRTGLASTDHQTLNYQNRRHCPHKVTDIKVIIITMGGAIAYWFACWTNDREIGVPVPLTAGRLAATVGQLLFAPWAWVYSTLHPFGVSK